MSGWLPIRYRDFYDLPRAIVVEFQGTMYLLDCLFDIELDDYESTYKVYRVPEDLRLRIDRISWTDLGHRSELVGQIAATDIEFDATKRRAVQSRSLLKVSGLVDGDGSGITQDL